MSRLQLAAPAVRPKLKARMMLSGPSGAGKTDSALTIARALTTSFSRILVIDTEKGSALTYTEKFTDEGGPFRHLPWEAPYPPKELALTMNEAGNDPGIDVIICDSLTHFWTKTGGTLDLADAKFGGWKTARPAQEEMVDALLGTDAHVIVCVRAKVEYTQQYNEKTRRQEVKKLGMAPQQDATLDYEMNIAVEMDLDHNMFVSKSRTTTIPVGSMFNPGHARTFGEAYADWLAGGTEMEAPTVEALKVRLGALSPALADRMRGLWVERQLPHIDSMNPQQVLRANGLIDQLEQDAAATAPLAQAAPGSEPQEAPRAQLQRYAQQAAPGDPGSEYYR